MGGSNLHKATRTNNDKGFSVLLFALSGPFRLEFQHKTSSLLSGSPGTNSFVTKPALR
jgi:hypothetical protein